MNVFVVLSLGFVFFLACFLAYMTGLYVFPRAVNHGRRSSIPFLILSAILIVVGFWIHTYVFGHYFVILQAGVAINFVASFFISRPPNLKKMQANGEVEKIIHVLNTYLDIWLLIEAMDALGDMGDKRAIDPMLNFREHESKVLVEAMHENLVKFGDDAVDVLIQRLGQADVDANESSLPWICTLEHFEGEKVRKVLLEHMEHAPWRVALCAMDSLVRQGWMWPIEDKLTELHHRILVLDSDVLYAALQADENAKEIPLRLPLHASEDVQSGKQFTNYSVIMGDNDTMVKRDLVEWAYFLRLVIERAVEAAYVPEAGIDFWNQACIMAPDYGFAWYGLGCVHALNEEKEIALAVLEQAYLKTYNKSFEIYKTTAEVGRGEFTTQKYINKINSYLHQLK